MSNFFRSVFVIEVDFLAEYMDFFSFFVIILLSVLLSAGVKESSILNNIFTTVNMATVIIVIFSGAMGKGIQIGFAFLSFQPCLDSVEQHKLKIFQISIEM